MEKVIYTTYSEELDITFIMGDVNDEHGTVSTEVKGFYYGSPDEDDTKEFYGKLKATF